MAILSEAEWSFKHILGCDNARGRRLEAADQPGALADTLARALRDAFGSGEYRVAIDSRLGEPANLRAIFQFRVIPETYDWFFNARTGYRAQFLLGQDIGIGFNAKLVEGMSDILSQMLPAVVDARCVRVASADGSRHERHDGSRVVERETFIASLTRGASKIWICEWLHDAQQCLDIARPLLIAAQRDLPKLDIPRWSAAKNPATGEKGEGLRAPLPLAEQSWLDLKGSFIDENGSVSQPKSQDARAQQIHDLGWT